MLQTFSRHKISSYEQLASKRGRDVWGRPTSAARRRHDSDPSSTVSSTNNEEDSNTQLPLQLQLQLESNFNSAPKLVFRMSETGPSLLRQVFLAKGWVEYVPGKTPYWNLWWKGARFTKSEHAEVCSWQRVNHFPNTAVITRKDSLFRLLKTMKAVHGKLYNFFPQTFILPNDYCRFVQAYSDDDEYGKQSYWICKPVDQSRGRGIFVFSDLKDLVYDCNAVVQRYIAPYLLSGYKFDIRVYVLVKSYHPLVVYIYEEGLARFATHVYDTKNLTDRFSHLTNTSINKHNLEGSDLLGKGCKWTLAKLREYFESQGVDYEEKIWSKIKAIIMLTILPMVSQVPGPETTKNCFELYGFDILIDENLKPWILEVNLSPALTADEDIDLQVKIPLLKDVVALSGITENDAIDAAKYCGVYEEADDEGNGWGKSRTHSETSLGSRANGSGNHGLTTNAGVYVKLPPIQQKAKSNVASIKSTKQSPLVATRHRYCPPTRKSIMSYDQYPQRQGQFSLIFPFDRKTAEIGAALKYSLGPSNGAMNIGHGSGQQAIKLAVQAVRGHYLNGRNL